MEINGFSTIPANTLITITMRVFIPYIPLNPYFKISINIGNRGTITLNPIMKNSITSSPTIIPGTFISSLMGIGG